MNAGADYTSKTGSKDLTGLARKVGGKVDMGAYELPAATAVPADYDGDGITDPALYFAASGEWWIWESGDSGSVRKEKFGVSGALPLAADFDGDGKANVACYTSAAKVPELAYLDADGETAGQTFGAKGALPVVAKLPGTSGVTFGAYTANAKKPAYSFTTGDAVAFGAKGAKPVVADFTGDLYDELGAYTSSASSPAFTLLASEGGYSTAKPFTVAANPFYKTARKSFALGAKGSVPCCADFDGDGRADFAAYTQTAAAPAFIRLMSASKCSEIRTLPYGKKGDVPVGEVYERGKSATPIVWTSAARTYLSSPLRRS